MPMTLKNFSLTSLVLFLGLALCSCSKNNDSAEQGQSYIPEPAATSPATENTENSETQGESENKEENNADEQDPSSATSDSTDIEKNNDVPEQSADNSSQNTDENVQNTSDDAKAEDAEKPAESAFAAAVKEEIQEEEKQSSSENSDETKSEEIAKNTSENNENEENKGEKTENTESEKKNNDETFALDANPQDVMAEPEPIFGSCENMHKYMAACAPFKCSRPTTFLGQTLDDTFEIKGKRNGKCRYVTGVHMQQKGKTIDSVNLICNLGDGERLMASEYLKNPENIKYTTLNGIQDNSKNTVKPFTVFFADNVCVKACKKSQTEIEQTVLENGHFVTKKVRCPSDD